MLFSFSLFHKTTLGISLGSSNTYIARHGKGIVLGEPSVVATDIYNEKVVAIGDKAKKMIGRAPETISVDRPISGGIISDFDKTVAMLCQYVSRVVQTRIGITSAIVVPAAASSVERRSMRDMAKAAYGSRVVPVDEPIAAALGCGLDVFSGRGHIIVDIGGGRTDISVVANGGVMLARSLSECSGTFDRDIINFVRKNYNILIGDGTAEDVKKQLGCASDVKNMELMTLNGRHLISGLPENFVLSSEDVHQAIASSVRAIVDGIMTVLGKIPPEIASDLIRSKIHLVGGGALMKGWTELIYKETAQLRKLDARKLRENNFEQELFQKQIIHRSRLYRNISCRLYVQRIARQRKNAARAVCGLCDDAFQHGGHGCQKLFLGYVFRAVPLRRP